MIVAPLCECGDRRISFSASATSAWQRSVISIATQIAYVRARRQSPSHELFSQLRWKSMATWKSERFQEDGNTDGIDSSFDSILVTHDLQDCLDETLDLSSFEKVYEQSAVFDYERYSDDDAAINERLPDDNTTGWDSSANFLDSSSRFFMSSFFNRARLYVLIRRFPRRDLRANHTVSISFVRSSDSPSPPYKAITCFEIRA